MRVEKIGPRRWAASNGETTTEGSTPAIAIRRLRRTMSWAELDASDRDAADRRWAALMREANR